jgi:Rrf2 family transcriptional regulator, cysteine metabolism repressor
VWQNLPLPLAFFFSLLYYIYDRISHIRKIPMKLTNRCEYALLALAHLGRCAHTTYVPVEKIASSQGIPPKFLEQILLILKRARYLQSAKGQGGGYRLARPVAAISVAEIIRLFDGALAPTDSVSTYFYDHTPIEKEKMLLQLFREIRDFIAHKLESTMIADIL